VTFNRLELQGKLLALEDAIVSGEGEVARKVVVELRDLIAKSTLPISARGP